MNTRSSLVESENEAAHFSLLQNVLHAMPEAMIAVDQACQIILANLRFGTLFGYADQNICGRAADILIPGAFRDTWPGHSRGLGQTLLGRHADGHEFLVDVRISPFLFGGEAITLATVRDASVRQTVEAETRLNAQMLHSLINGVVDYAIYMLDAQGQIMTWNAGAKIIKGYDAEEIIGRHLSVFFTDEDRLAGAPEQALETARRHGRFENEAWRVRKDGTRFFAHVTLDAIHEGPGIIVGFAKITRDITEKKRAEQLALETERLAEEAFRNEKITAERERAHAALRQTSETLSALIAASPLGVCMLSREGVVEVWNRSCERIYGYAAREIIGFEYEALYQLLVVGDQPNPPVIWPPPDRKSRTELKFLCRRKDGSIADIGLSHATVREPDGEPIGYVYIINDITERLSIEAQLRQSQKMEAVGQLTGGLAHDFNNLLSIIICNLELVIESVGAETKDLREPAQIALDASLRGAQLIQQLLAFSRKQHLVPTSVQINDLVVGITHMLKRSLGEQINIALKTDPALWPSNLDPVQFQTALANLATNARDAMPQGGDLVIETANIIIDANSRNQFPELTPGDYVEIAVSDNGEGMPPEIVARAFDPFFTTKSVGSGTGLGLSMVFGFVKQSAGHIRIDSEPGRGTTVKIYLPRSTLSETASVPYEETVKSAKPFGTILVVEDNADLATSVEGILRNAGYSPFVANSANEALLVLEGPAEIALLFTDIILRGGMNGIDLANLALSRRENLKVLFTSGFAEVALGSTYSATVADRIISKPYRKADLLAKIADVLKPH